MGNFTSQSYQKWTKTRDKLHNHVITDSNGNEYIYTGANYRSQTFTFKVLTVDGYEPPVYEYDGNRKYYLVCLFKLRQDSVLQFQSTAFLEYDRQDDSYQLIKADSTYNDYGLQLYYHLQTHFANDIAKLCQKIDFASCTLLPTDERLKPITA